MIGASNDVRKPGGKLLKNILGGDYAGELHVVHRSETKIQGVACKKNVADLPDVDLAILAIPARFCPDTMRELADTKKTRAFIVISAASGCSS